MKGLSLVIAILFSTIFASAQNIKGRIQNDVDGSVLAGVTVENLSHPALTSTSGTDGKFAVTAYKNDTLRFKLLGFTPRSLVFTGINQAWFESIVLVPQGMMLDTIVIGKELTAYQKDSLERRQLYGKQADFRPAKTKYDPKKNPVGLDAPISGLIEKHTKYAKQLKRFQEMYASDEKAEFIASKYDPEMVSTLTGLQDDSLYTFMQAYPMPYEYARGASDLEIKMWVKYNYKEWLKTNPVVPAPSDNIPKQEVHALEKP